jgi:KDO2-lipid IV(A) lauroyltransferase
MSAAASAGPAPRPERLLRRKDLYRIPVWTATKVLYVLVPVPWLFRLARAKGHLAYYVSRRRGRTLDALRESLGAERSERELRRIARRHFAFRHAAPLARVWPKLRGFERWARRPVDGISALDEALTEGAGVVVVTAHVGYARLVKPVLRAQGYTVSLVGDLRRPRRRTRLDRLVRDRLLRLPHTSSDDEIDITVGINIRPLLAALGRNEIVILLADGIGASAIYPVEVLGRTIHLASGVVSIARTTGSPVVPVFALDGSPDVAGVRLEVRPPLDLPRSESLADDVAGGLERLRALLDDVLREYPHLWLWSSGVLRKFSLGAESARWQARERTSVGSQPG